MKHQSLYTIAPDRPFVDALALGLLAQAGDDPLALSDMLVLLPTRRACRSLREAFLRQAEGKAMLLPRMQPVGDVDEEELILTAPGTAEGALAELTDLPPAISETERLLLLTRLVKAQRNQQATMDTALDPIGPDQALLLARELARLLDQVQTEGLSLDRLDGLVPELYAEHWGVTLDFLNIIRTAWPAHLVENGLIDPAERRNRLLLSQAELWRTSPPTHPVIAAGSTGSIPATAQLIATVAGLPQGVVVLPGLDRVLAEEDWGAVTEDATHPQHGLALLLQKLEATRADVVDWPGGGTGPDRTARVRLIAEALRPASTTERWRGLATSGGLDEAAFTGVQWLAAPSQSAEAEMAAQCLREVLETPGKTAALVTPDRILARRVAAQLDRWGIQIDDSAGRPLAQTESGRFFALTAEAVQKRLSPVALLALLKHPMAALGGRPGELRKAVRHLEVTGLRGPKPAGGPDGLRNALEARTQETRKRPSDEAIAAAKGTVDGIEAALQPLLEAMDQTEIGFDILLTAHIRAAEALAQTAEASGAEALWRGEDGEMLADFIADLMPVAHLLGPVGPGDYVALVDALMAGKTVRPRYGAHPRLAILGPLEARLQHADRLILAGLNEGVWPPEPGDDPWMSRAMRHAFGLPPHERRIGLSAHDFAQAFGAPEVVLLRSSKTGGQQTVPARWLERLATVTERLGLDHILPKHNTASQQHLLWQQHLDSWDRLPMLQPPAPRPPVDKRPRQLSATRIETLMRDPYSIFASRILKLDVLDPLESDLGAADKGTMIHRALDLFTQTYPDRLPPDAAEKLIEIGRQVFGPEALARPTVRAFWWPRFERIAVWFLAQEASRRPKLAQSFTEISGKIKILAPAGEFLLTAEADRIDRYRDGGYAILDYKTGTMPNKKAVGALTAPQLPLEAAILKGKGFTEITPGPIVELAYWKLSGGEPAGSIQVNDVVDPDDLAQTVLDKLTALIAAYDDPNTAYPAVPRPGEAPRFNDYAHLARIKEWSLGGDADGGES
ncbi:MAG: double-strand break repair protein AddB [Alphaproteobacteria bacterium]|nr:double-strand break repair protein AddB [Alphaproteobacteria bacterium]